MKKPTISKQEITYSPEIVKKAIITGLQFLHYLPSDRENHFTYEIRIYRCGSEKNHEIGVKIIVK